MKDDDQNNELNESNEMGEENNELNESNELGEENNESNESSEERTEGTEAEGTTEHSDYKPVSRFDAAAVHHLSGMYQNWFLDYASYVILERAVPHIEDGL